MGAAAAYGDESGGRRRRRGRNSACHRIGAPTPHGVSLKETRHAGRSVGLCLDPQGCWSGK
jgi:hypothetical protein